MKKLLFLFAVLLGTVGAWAQTDLIEVSTSVDTPENMYEIKSAAGHWMTSYTSPSDKIRGCFAFFDDNDANTENAYKIFSVTHNKWVSYAKSRSYADGVNKAVLVDTQAEANAWNATTETAGDNEYYQFAPYKEDGSVASIYWNWHGGLNSNPYNNVEKTIGFYGKGAVDGNNGDPGSRWVLSKVNEFASEGNVAEAKSLIKIAVGYPSKSSGAYVLLNSMTTSGVVAPTSLTEACKLYRTTSDIVFPENGQAYTLSNVRGNAGREKRYMVYEKGKKVYVSTKETDASVFICRELRSGVYAFVTEDGTILTWIGNNEGGAYKENGNIYGYSSFYATSYNNCNDWNEITVEKYGATEDNFGHFHLYGRRKSDDFSALIVKHTDDRFDQSNNTRYFNDTFSSAWIFTEVEDHKKNDAQNLALAKIDAKLHIAPNASKLGDEIGYGYYLDNETKLCDVTQVNSAIDNATTIDAVNGIKNSLRFNIPKQGVQYSLYDETHNVFLDIHNLVQAPDQSTCSHCNKLATLNVEKTSLYITALSDDETNFNQWKIHTDVGGGEYLKESLCAQQHNWNSEVSEGEFVWEVNHIKIEDIVFYSLKNINGNRTGFLGTATHADGNALFANQQSEDCILKMRLHETSLMLKVEDASGVATVLYKGDRYANGDYICADEGFAESDFDLVDVIGYTFSLEIEDGKLTVSSTQNFNPDGLNVLLKNKGRNVYMGIEILGGTLDNATVPTKHRLTSTQNYDYRNCWELKLTTYDTNVTSTPCFALYNKYYDWYVGKITTRDGAINIEKNIADAGRFDIDYVEEVNAQQELTGNKVLTFKCLNKTTSDDYWYLHQVTSNNYAVVDWDYTADASKWYMIEVTPEDESNWLEQLNDELTAFKNSVNLGTGIGQYSGLTDEQLNNIAVPEDLSDLEKAKYCLTTMHDYYSMLVINQPTPGFYRFKAYNTNKYLQNYSSNNNFQLNDNKDIRSIMYLSEDKTMLSYGNGQYLNDYKNPVPIGDAALAWTLVKNDKVLGHYALDMNQYAYLNINNSWVASSNDNNAGSAWEIEPVETLPFTFKEAGLGFATFNAPVAVKLPEGVLAYVTQIKLDNNTLQMYRLKDKVVPANTPVMLYCEAAKTEDATKELTIVSTYTGNEFDGFKYNESFYGTIAAVTYPTDCTIYSLRKSAGKNTVGFYQKADGSLGGFKAWIKLDEESDAQGARTFTIIFDGDDATGLKEALGLENENVEIYDLSGRRLDKPAKGVNVIGGKLVIK